MAKAPPGAESCGAPGIPTVGRHQGGDRHEVVGIRGVPEAEDERDPKRDEQRSAVEQPGERRVELLDRPDQELEVDEVDDYLLAERSIIRAAGSPLT